MVGHRPLKSVIMYLNPRMSSVGIIIKKLTTYRKKENGSLFYEES